MMIDDPGINFLAELQEVSVVPSQMLVTAENAAEIRKTVKTLVLLVNQQLTARGEPFRLRDELSGLDDEVLCMGNNGRKEYLRSFVAGEKQAPIMTEVSAENVVRALHEFRKGIRGDWRLGMDIKMKPNKTIANFSKGEQAGKTQDSLNRLILICICNILEGVDTCPLVVLTKEFEHEEALKQDWKIIEGFWNLVSIEYLRNGKVANRRKVLTILKEWGEFDTFWVRRSSGLRQKQKFAQYVQEAVTQRKLVMISLDEADVGIGPQSTLDKWFEEPVYKSPNNGDVLTLYQALTSNFPLICLSCYSATLNPFKVLQHFAVDIPVLEEKSYQNWTIRPIYKLMHYGENFGVPELDLVGITCSPAASPYKSVNGFIKHCLKKKDDGTIRWRRAKEKLETFTKNELQFFGNCVDVQELYQYFRSEFVPQTLAKFFENRLLKHNHSSHKIICESANARHLKKLDLPLPGFVRKMRGMMVRYITNNIDTNQLIQDIRKYLSDDKVILIPFFGIADVVNGKAVNYQREYRKAITAIKASYRLRGIKEHSRPYVLFVTASARRGVRLSDNVVQVEFTHDPTTLTSMKQADGRTGGFKENTELVLTDRHWDEARDLIEKKSTKRPSIYTERDGNRAGRPTKTLGVYRGQPGCEWFEKIFEYVDKHLLNQPDQIDKARKISQLTNAGTSKKGHGLQGGEDLAGKGGKCLFDFLTVEHLQRVAQEHAKFFVQDDGKPMFDYEPDFQIWDTSKVSQPNSLLTIKSGKYERYGVMVVNSDNTKKHPSITDATFKPTRHKLFFPCGFRYGRDSLTNTKARHHKSEILQPQIHYEFDENRPDGQKMRCECIHFRLRQGISLAYSEVPMENSIPDKLGSTAERDSWHPNRTQGAAV